MLFQRKAHEEVMESDIRFGSLGYRKSVCFWEGVKTATGEEKVAIKGRRGGGDCWNLRGVMERVILQIYT